MSDMQQNFDHQLVGKESEMNSRLDIMRQEHETELSGITGVATLCYFFHLLLK